MHVYSLHSVFLEILPEINSSLFKSCPVYKLNGNFRNWWVGFSAFEANIFYFKVAIIGKMLCKSLQVLLRGLQEKRPCDILVDHPENLFLIICYKRCPEPGTI